VVSSFLADDLGQVWLNLRINPGGAPCPALEVTWVSLDRSTQLTQATVGDTVRHAELGLGRITDLVDRELDGERSRFVEIVFPQRGMAAFVPLSDAKLTGSGTPAAGAGC